MYGLRLRKAIIVFPCKFAYLFQMIRVAAGIIFRSGTNAERKEVLLCQRKESARYALKWEFPGGKIENEEAFTDGLRRELNEELGIRAEVGALFHRQHSVYPDKGSYDVAYYLIRGFSGEISNRAFAQWVWTPVAELASYDILEGNREVTRKLIDRYGRA
jgi:8-oxo-dGTP diphosphatase